MRDEDRKCSLKQAQVQAISQMIKVYGLPNNDNAAKHYIDSGDRDDTRLCAYAQALSIS